AVAEDPGRLAEQVQDRLVAGKFRQHDLDRDMVAGLDVVAAIDFAHAAGRDPLVEFVDAAELRADAGMAEARRNPRLVVVAHLLSLPPWTDLRGAAVQRARHRS